MQWKTRMLAKATKTKQPVLLVFSYYWLMISVSGFIHSRSTMEAAMLCHHPSAVARNVDLLGAFV